MVTDEQNRERVEELLAGMKLAGVGKRKRYDGV